MPTTPRAIGRAKALTAGSMLAAAVATGGVAVHLADAQTTTAAASPTVSEDSGTAAGSSGTTSDDTGTGSDDDSSSDDDSTSSSSSGTSASTSNGFSQPGPVAPAQAPAQSSTNGS